MKKPSKKPTREQQLLKQIDLLSWQLDESLQLLEHQKRHLVFLETLLGDSCKKPGMPVVEMEKVFN
jgi:hypothetical protein